MLNSFQHQRPNRHAEFISATGIAEKVTVKFKDPARPEVVKGVFTMDDVMKFVDAMPEEILPPYRKQRTA